MSTEPFRMSEYPALFSAAEAGKLRWIESALDAGAPIDCVDRMGQTPLMEAAAHGRTGAVQLLLRRGANARYVDDMGWGALHIACMEPSPGVYKALLKAGIPCDLEDGEGKTPLMTLVESLVQNGSSGGEELEVLLRAGANPHHADHEGQTPADVIMANPRLFAAELQERMRAGKHLAALDQQTPAPVVRAPRM